MDRKHKHGTANDEHPAPHQTDRKHPPASKRVRNFLQKNKYALGLSGLFVYVLFISGLIYHLFQLPVPKNGFALFNGTSQQVISPTYSSPQPSVVIAPSKAAFAAFTGDVRVQQRGVWLKASSLQTLGSNDAVYTGTKSSATLAFTDGSLLRLSENSFISLTDYTRTDTTTTVKLYQLVGQSWNRVQHLSGRATSYQVETNTTVATVRGTAFGIDTGSAGSTIIVAEGTVSAQLVNRSTDSKVVLPEVTILKNQSFPVSEKLIADISTPQAQHQPQGVYQQQLQPKNVAATQIPDWVKFNLAEDTKILPIIEKFKEHPNDEKQLLHDLRQELKSDLVAASPNSPPESQLVSPPPLNPFPSAYPTPLNNSSLPPGQTKKTGIIPSPTPNPIHSTPNASASESVPSPAATDAPGNSGNKKSNTKTQ